MSSPIAIVSIFESVKTCPGETRRRANVPIEQIELFDPIDSGDDSSEECV
jgi:hypothetical protein